MISLNDIIQENETRGELRLRLSARALLRALIVIGQLPRSRARSELLAAPFPACRGWIPKAHLYHFSL